MGSLSSPTPAGAHCLWPLCSHTCCLDAEQRVQDTFPVITLVDASEWLDAGLLAGASSHGSGNDFSDISWVALPMGALRREDVSIPTYSSDVSDHLEAHREHDTPKIKTIHIDLPPTDTSTSQPSKAMLMWVPSSRSPPPPDYRHGSKSPRLTVKELIFQPVGDMDTPVDNKKRLNQDKSGKTVLKPSPAKLNQKGKGCLKSKVDTSLSGLGLSDSDLQVKKIAAVPQVHCLALMGQALTADPKVKENQQPPRSAQTLREQTGGLPPCPGEEAEEAHPGGPPYLQTRAPLSDLDSGLALHASQT
ncbi:uncharacterized protein LOC125012409 isoform X2 [Mugil cephalus]|uniref:uncharacterized protein LOC125012409 isoform X2 n=1 Tax=Mugil cephalus TaxID=48193 RepID=UPI001FB745B2|nr:uncharacterized protein LOC125012409 isoform X2 [Mugil cephalus]XP_047448307.1 uncharacterized protein LOC125012409 isoform X2 [Mugil cephalus]XP_047448308.1 uncharacterized protein LOC125012409 isoform X2 [Mugil cephalus]